MAKGAVQCTFCFCILRRCPRTQKHRIGHPSTHSPATLGSAKLVQGTSWGLVMLVLQSSRFKDCTQVCMPRDYWGRIPIKQWVGQVGTLVQRFLGNLQWHASPQKWGFEKGVEACAGGI
eukprot:scaffold144803_cov22-Tisochrysis_lutea.AAC.3